MKKARRINQGETLTETLFALLVIVVSSVMLATMLASAMNLNRKAVSQDQKFYEELTMAETKGNPLGTGKITIRLKGGGYHLELPINYYGKDEGLVSYGQAEG